MLKTISLKLPTNLITTYRIKQKTKKEYDKEFEEYMWKEIMKTEERVKSGKSKTYTEEEFIEEMRVRYGIILPHKIKNAF